MKTLRLTPTMALLLIAAHSPFHAGASTVETFSFTQSGYAVGTLTGTFTGTLESDGSIQLADLTAFSISYSINLGPPSGIETDSYSLQDLKLFSFMPGTNGPNSSLDFFAGITTGTPGSICVGAAAAFGLCGQGGNIAGEDHLRYAQNPFLFITTTEFAAVNLVPPTSTPEPPTLWMWGLGAGLAIVGRISRASRLARGSIR